MTQNTNKENPRDIELTLTPLQIENWRTQLTMQFGPYARIMPEADIQAYANKIQSAFNNPTNQPKLWKQ